MGIHFEQIGLEERASIWTLKSLGRTARSIARALGRAPSTISRELRANANDEQDFTAKVRKAQYLSECRRSETRRRPWLKSAGIRDFVEKRLTERWSPELIANALRIEEGLKITAQSIYNYIHFKRPDLTTLLPRQGRRIRRIHPRKRVIKKPKKAPKRRSILQRPSSATNRSRFGHWEADTVESHAGESRLVVAAERKSRLVKIRKLKKCNSRSFKDKIVSMFSSMPKKAVRTFTFDRGAENALHHEIDQTLGTTSFFCEPLHSWEKGTVENIIGIIRYFFPKNTNFDQVSNAQIAQLEKIINRRPRQILNYMTPSAVFGVAFSPG